MFESPPGENPARRCTECGLLARPDHFSAPAEATGKIRADEPASEAQARKKRLVRKKRQSHAIYKVLFIWLLLAVAAFFIFRPDPPEEEKPGTAAETRPALPPQDAALLKQALPECIATLMQFFAAATPEQRAQFVHSPILNTGKMQRFYQRTMLNIPPSEELAPLAGTVIHFDGEPVIELRVKSTKKPGVIIDAAFREQEGEWRLDWPALARYSTESWPLFLAGSGDGEGEFRLYARERLPARYRKTESISLAFYAPQFAKPAETGDQSPEFLISRDSANGKLLAAAFALAREKQRPFGSLIPEAGPDGLIPVRAIFRRTDHAGQRKVELVKIAACHWYDTDLPGIEIPGKN